MSCVWDDVRAALDSAEYAGRPIDGQGRILAEIVSTALSVFQQHVALGTIREAPQVEAKLGKDYVVRLYVRGESKPRWMT